MSEVIDDAAERGKAAELQALIASVQETVRAETELRAKLASEEAAELAEAEAPVPMPDPPYLLPPDFDINKLPDIVADAIRRLEEDDWLALHKGAAEYGSEGKNIVRLNVVKVPTFIANKKSPPTLRDIHTGVLECLGQMEAFTANEVIDLFNDERWWARQMLLEHLGGKKATQMLRDYFSWWAWFREKEVFSKTFRDFDPFKHYHFVKRVGTTPAIVFWDKDGRLVVQSHAEFRASHLRSRTITWPNGSGGFRDETIADRWLKTPSKEYESIGFYPGLNGPVEGDLNLWRGWNAKRVEGVEDNVNVFPPLAAKWLDHVFENVCGHDADVFVWLMTWVAEALNYPRRSPQFAIVLTGPQGSGKGTFAETVLRFFDPHGLILDKPNALTGNFNAHLEDALMIFADEAVFAGDRKAAATMKSLITSPKIAIERKGFDLYMAPKRFRVILATNDAHAINAEGDDRRYLVLKVDAGENNNDDAYFRAIREDLDRGGYDQLFTWLTSECWKVRDLGPRPKTAELERQKDLSLRGPDAVVFAMLESGTPPCDVLYEGDEMFVPTAELAAKARLDATASTALGKLLGALGGKPARPYIRNEQTRGFWLPSLPECRRAWQKKLGRSVEWPEEVTSWDQDVDRSGRFRELGLAFCEAAKDLPPEERTEWYRLVATLREKLDPA